MEKQMLELKKMGLFPITETEMQTIDGGGFFEWVGEQIGAGAHYVYNWAKGDYVPAGSGSNSTHVVK